MEVKLLQADQGEEINISYVVEMSDGKETVSRTIYHSISSALHEAASTILALEEEGAKDIRIVSDCIPLDFIRSKAEEMREMDLSPDE